MLSPTSTFMRMPATSNCCRGMPCTILKLGEHDPYLRGLSVWIGFKQEKVFYERNARHSGEKNLACLIALTLTRNLSAASPPFPPPVVFRADSGVSGGCCGLRRAGFRSLYEADGKQHPGVDGHHGGGPVSWRRYSFTIGILGIYMARIYEQIKGRPRYIVNNQIGFD